MDLTQLQQSSFTYGATAQRQTSLISEVNVLYINMTLQADKGEFTFIVNLPLSATVMKFLISIFYIFGHNRSFLAILPVKITGKL